MSADAPALARIAEAAFTQYVKAIGKPPAPMYPDFPDLISKGWVSVPDREEVQAYAVTYPDGAALQLDAVAVAPEAQGLGLGRFVIEAVEARAGDLGLARVALYTNVAMAGNLTWYPKLGYSEVDRRREEGFERVYFEKDIRGLSEDRVRQAFVDQAVICRKLQAPFTTMVIDAAAEVLGRETAVGRRVLDWLGEPEPRGDALALRLAGALHGAVRAGELPLLSTLYPPAETPDYTVLKAALADALEAAEAKILAWLDHAPQTNEVGRSGILYPGLMVIGHAFGPRMELLELGASAGLNLVLFRYGFGNASVSLGNSASPVQIRPDWRGPWPEGPEPEIVKARGVDLNPLDLTDEATVARLTSYGWPDQPERLARLEAAIEVARAELPKLDAGDAADWLEQRLAEPATPGVTRVVMHTIAYQYFPEPVKARVRAALEKAGAEATREAPLAWLAFEMEGSDQPVLTLQLWPGHARRQLAVAHPHGTWIEWDG